MGLSLTQGLSSGASWGSVTGMMPQQQRIGTVGINFQKTKETESSEHFVNFLKMDGFIGTDKSVEEYKVKTIN